MLTSVSEVNIIRLKIAKQKKKKKKEEVERNGVKMGVFCLHELCTRTDTQSTNT